VLDYKTVREMTPANCYHSLIFGQVTGSLEGKPSIGDPQKTFGEIVVDALRDELTLLENSRAITGKDLDTVSAYFCTKAEQLPDELRDISLFKIKAATHVLATRDEVVS